MNLDFGILWIEDSYSKEEEASLRRRVSESGFVARIESQPNGDGLDDRARHHSLYHSYDLILLDYRLRNENGDELAGRVRELFPSTTILFYSGSVDEQRLRRMMADKQIEGVYCSARSRFIERTGGLIEQTARSLDRLSGMRGLASRVVAECDELMKAAVISMSSRHPGCAETVSDLDREVFAFIEGSRAKYEAAISKDLQARIDTRAVDSAKLHSHFRRLTRIVTSDKEAFGLDGEQADRLRELRAKSAQYVDRVLYKRNLLSHVVEVQGSEGWVIQGGTGITVADFAGIRSTFAEHIDAIREMCKLVSV